MMNLARLAQETLEILAKGRYRAPSGGWVYVADDLRRAVEGTMAYPPDAAIARKGSVQRSTEIVVERQSTLEATRALVAQEHRPVDV